MALSLDPCTANIEYARRVLVEELLRAVPGSVSASVRIDSAPVEWDVVVTVGFSTGLESRFVSSVPVDGFDSVMSTAAFMSKLVAKSAEVFRDKVSQIEVARWRWTRIELEKARAAIGEADAAFEEVEKLVR